MSARTLPNSQRIADIAPRRGPGEPLYAVIKNFVIDGIKSGALSPGDRLPSEVELVEKFGVSRMTANRALRELQNEGTITRHAGVGSFIAERHATGQIIEIHNIADEIRSRGHEYHAEVIECHKVQSDPHIAGLMGIASGKPLFHSIIVHFEAGAPLQLEDRYVLIEFAPDYLQADFTRMTPNEYLTRIAPIDRFEHRVKALIPNAEERKLLAIRAGEPALVMERRTWSRNRIASFAKLTHPGNRFELAAST